MRTPTFAFAAGLLACIVAVPSAAKTRQTPEQRLAELTRGATPGPPQTCLNQFPSRSSETIDGIGIVYRDGRTLYLNRFANGCRIRFSDILVTRTPSAQLCRGDIATVIDNSSRIPHDSCVFADFIPYKLPK